MKRERYNVWQTKFYKWVQFKSSKKKMGKTIDNLIVIKMFALTQLRKVEFHQLLCYNKENNRNVMKLLKNFFLTNLNTNMIFQFIFKTCLGKTIFCRR